MDKDKIAKALNSKEETPKTTFRIDELAAQYKGKILPYSYGYRDFGDDYWFILDRAKNLRTPRRLMALAQIDSSDVREALLENKRITSEIIEFMWSQDKSRASHIVACSQTPAIILKELLQHEDIYVRKTAISHRNTTEEMLEPLIQNETDHSVLKCVIERLTSVESLKKVYDRFPTTEKVVDAIIYNEHTTTEMLTIIIKSNVTCSTDIIQHRNITPELLELLYPRWKDDSTARRRFAENNKTPEHIQKELILHDDDWYSKNAIQNSTFKLKVRERFTARNATEVLFVSDERVSELLDNDATTTEMLRAIYQKVKHDGKLIAKIIEHANVDCDLAEEIINRNREMSKYLNRKFEFYFEE